MSVATSSLWGRRAPKIWSPINGCWIGHFVGSQTFCPSVLFRYRPHAFLPFLPPMSSGNKKLLFQEACFQFPLPPMSLLILLKRNFWNLLMWTLLSLCSREINTLINSKWNVLVSFSQLHTNQNYLWRQNLKWRIPPSDRTGKSGRHFLD